MAARLGVHVLGPRYGESIILELPDGGVGVIDSFASTGTHPVVAFLEATYPQLTGLRFLGITHPHADHCFRVADIFHRFRPSEIWVFHPFPSGQVQSYYTALARRGTRDRVEAALGLPAGAVAESLLQFHNSVRQPVRTGTLHFRPFTGSQPVARFCSGRLRVSYLTPVQQAQFAYADEVERCTRQILDDGPTLRPVDDLPTADHNHTSGAILVEYGQTRALFMADAEGPRWEEWLATTPHADLLHTVDFLKVSHHGSGNGYHQPLYATLADRTRTVAVVTPFKQGNVSLPTAEGVRAIRPHVQALYCTNRSLAQASTGLAWSPVNLRQLPQVPRRWELMIQNRPQLAALLVPEVGAVVLPGPPPALPRLWVTDAQRSPELWRLLRAEHCPPSVSGPGCTDYVVSAWYNNQGGRLELRAGAGAGHLP
jgi:hypothetical protein